jgi:DNA-binding cell septation regulator SpoVG
VSAPYIADARFTPSRQHDVERGLLGYASFTYGSLVIECVVRRTVNGRLYVAFPARTDASGKRESVVRPVGKAARERIERELLTALQLDGGQP